ncbi:unnamed protein product, partial [Mesorhabditis belari]|uniref:Uncharacterized protein n=1 Tax=Mesorhabditis belari TaxID=2138241 RepID=A0AAF3ERK4_9BILA
MNSLSIFSLFLFILFCEAQTNCKLNVKFRSKTSKPVQVDMIIPGALIKMEPFVMSRMNQNKSVMVKGDGCEKKHWVVRTWKEDEEEESGWKLAKKIQMRLYGNGGWIRILIEDDYTPRLMDRMGVICSDGACGK